MARPQNSSSSSGAPATAGDERPAENKSPLSLNRLREAFATMLRPATHEPRPEHVEPKAVRPAPRAIDPCEISPRTVVEAILFVGRPDNRPFSARELAATMRDVSPTEIDEAVAALNALYVSDGSPYEITGSTNGYQLALRQEYSRMRDKLQGRIRETKLSPAALEVLSIVAYNQPTTLDEINNLRGAASGAVLSALVRRRVVRLDRPKIRGQKPVYATTGRFLRLFGLESLAALPRSEELEKS